MATIKKPKGKRYPKRPKASASLEVWERFRKRCGEVEKENKAALSSWKKKVNDKANIKKRKEAIIKQTKGLSGIAGRK